MPHIPPLAVARAAARGLDLRRRFERGGTAVGVARARDLSNRRAVSTRTLRRMVSYFARHAVDAEAPGWGDAQAPSAGWVAWLLWGGDSGRVWATRELARMEAAMKQKNPRSGPHWHSGLSTAEYAEQAPVRLARNIRFWMATGMSAEDAAAKVFGMMDYTLVKPMRASKDPRSNPSSKWQTKPGKYGTLYLFEVSVVYPTAPGHPPEKLRRWAYDDDHAVERVHAEMGQYAMGAHEYDIQRVSKVKS